MDIVRLDHSQATEKILEWYHDMRVDHIENDELVWEVTLRNIVIRDDPSFSRRRRSLREHLKVEKQLKTVLDGVIETNKVEEITICENKFLEISNTVKQNDRIAKTKCKARLLHYGHRVHQLLKAEGISPEESSFLKSLLIDIVESLQKEFYTENPNPANVQHEIDNEQALINLFNANPDSSQNNNLNQNVQGILSNNQQPVPSHESAQKSNGASSQNPENRTSTVSLQNRITELENELANLRILATQVSDANSARPMDCPPQPLNPSPIINPTIQHSVGFTNPLYQFQSNPFQNLPHGQPTSQPIPQVSSANNLPFSQYASQPWFNPSWPPVAPQVSYHHQTQNQTYAPQPQIPVPYSSYPTYPSATANPSRHTLPVSQWKITKYEGTDQGINLNEFLEIVQTFSLAEHVTEVELFESAVHLFAGPALKWYMTMRTTGRLLNWQHLVLELKRTFMHPDLDALIKMKIYQRRQQRSESFHEFYYEMEKLFRTMCVQIPEYEKVQILLQNIRIDYKKQLTFLPITDLPSLIAAGQKIDALNFSAYHKVFGVEKSVSAIGPVKQKQSTPEGNLNRQKLAQPTSHPHSDNTHKVSRSFHGSQNPHKHQAHTSNQPQHKPRLTLESLIDSYQPPPENTCYNCGIFGHSIRECRAPRAVLCENCGFRGYPFRNCPYCLKNARSASEKRGSLNP